MCNMSSAADSLYARPAGLPKVHLQGLLSPHPFTVTDEAVHPPECPVAMQQYFCFCLHDQKALILGCLILLCLLTVCSMSLYVCWLLEAPIATALMQPRYVRGNNLHGARTGLAVEQQRQLRTSCTLKSTAASSVVALRRHGNKLAKACIRKSHWPCRNTGLSTTLGMLHRRRDSQGLQGARARIYLTQLPKKLIP